jgi:hypothetical protein
VSPNQWLELDSLSAGENAVKASEDEVEVEARRVNLRNADQGPAALR